MNKLLLMGATVISAVAFPLATIAASSGTIDGEVTVPYACNVVTPALQTLTASGASATGSAAWSYDQNDDTTYSLSALSLLASNTDASLSGSIALADSSGTLVDQISAVSSTSFDQDGNYASTSGTVSYQISETVAPSLYAGDYDISTTLTCAQNVGEGGGGEAGGGF